MSMSMETRQHIPIPEREVYVPSWGYVHTNAGVEVKQHGRSLGFTVGEMLPERRWAVLPSGELLNQRDFEDGLKRWRTYACTRGGQVVAMAALNKHFDPGLEGYPQVADFVDRGLDPYGKLVPLTYLKKLRAIEDASARPKATEVPVGFSPVAAPEPVQTAPAPEPPKDQDLVRAKCGKPMDSRYLKQHMKYCQKGCQEFV